MQVKEFIKKLPAFSVPLLVLAIYFLFHNNLISENSWKIILGFLFSVTLALSLVPFRNYFKFKLPAKIEKYLPYILAGFGFVVYGIYGLEKFSHFQNPTWDFGLFDQVVWNLSKLHNTPTSLLGIHFFGDHFSPILYLIAPIYWIYNSPISLILFEILIVCLGALPVYWLAKKRFKTIFLPITLCLAYIFYIGNQYAINFSFHPTTLFATLFLFAFYFFEEKKYFWHFIFIILALMCREDTAIYIAAYGIFLLVRKRSIGTIHALVGAIWYVASTKYIMPHFASWVDLRYASFALFGKTPPEILRNIIIHPVSALSLFFNSPEKVLSFLSIFIGFGFLAILAPTFWIIILPMIGIRFWSSGLFWHSEFHYGAPISAILVLGTIFAISYLKKNIKFPLEFFISVFLLVNLCLMTYLLQLPVHNIVHKSFYSLIDEFNSVDKAIKLIPNQDSVSAQDPFVSHLSHRRDVFLFPNKEAKFILLDVLSSTYPVTKLEYNKEVKEILASPNYGIKFNEGRVILFERGLISDIKPSNEVTDALNQN